MKKNRLTRKQKVALGMIILSCLLYVLMPFNICLPLSACMIAVKPVVHSFYKMTDHRKHFYTTDACTSCGLCAANCPCQAIVMEQNKPMWKEDCSFCLKCIHSCPVQALQHGKGTEKRSRYLNHMKEYRH